jgi:hypothetical protein
MFSTMRIHDSVRSAWAYIGHVSTIHWLGSLGLAGSAAALAYGRKFLDGMDAAPRLGVILGLALVVLALSLAFFRFVFPPPAPSFAEVEDLQAVIEGGKKIVASLHRENEELRNQASQARQAEEEARAGRENIERRGTEIYEKMVYGEELPQIHSLTQEALSLLVMNLHELLPNFGTMHTGAREVWAGLVYLARQQQHNQALRPLVDRVEHTEHAQFEVAAHDFSMRLQNRGDARALLCRTYTTYRNWRSEMLRTADFLGHPIQTVQSYISWSTGEARFMEDLRKKLAIQEMVPVARVIRDYDQMHGLPEPLP